MKPHTRIAASLLLGMVPCMAVYAADDNPSGLYVGAGIGGFKYKADNIGDVGQSVADIIDEADDTSWKAFVGWRFMPYLAVEAAYIDFGAPGDSFSTSGSNGNYEVALSGFAPYLIGTLPLGPVELFARLGYYYYDVDTKIDFDGPNQGIDSSHSGDDLIYGAGIGITLFDHLNVRVEYETVDIEDASKSDAIWLSGAWRF